MQSKHSLNICTITPSGWLQCACRFEFVSDLGFGLPTMQRIEMVNGTLRRCPRVGEDLEDVKVMSQGVGSYQQHSYKEHIVIDIRNQSVSRLHCKLILNVCCINGSYFIVQLLECMPFVCLFFG